MVKAAKYDWFKIIELSVVAVPAIFFIARISFKQDTIIDSQIEQSRQIKVLSDTMINICQNQKSLNANYEILKKGYNTHTVILNDISKQLKGINIIDYYKDPSIFMFKQLPINRKENDSIILKKKFLCRVGSSDAISLK